MMLDRRIANISLIVLALSGVVQLFAGVLDGLGQDWMGMTIYFAGAVFAVVICTNIAVALKMDTYLSRLENLILQKSDSVQPFTTMTSNGKEVRGISNVMKKGVCILMVISVPVHVSLAIFGVLHQESFRCGIHLVAGVFTVVICIGVLMSLKIGTCFRHLEELISGGN